MGADIATSPAIPAGYRLVTSINQLRHGTTLYQIFFEKDVRGRTRTRTKHLGEVDGFPWCKEGDQTPDYVRVSGPKASEVDCRLRNIGFPATSKSALLVLDMLSNPDT